MTQRNAHVILWITCRKYEKDIIVLIYRLKSYTNNMFQFLVLLMNLIFKKIE